MKINVVKKRLIQIALLGCSFLLLLLVSCLEWWEEPDQLETLIDENGVLVAKSRVWKADVTKKGNIRVLTVPIFYKNTVIVPGSPEINAGMLVALDIKTGEEVWRWSDYVDGYYFGEVSSEEQLNSKNGIAIYKENNSFWAVDLNKGTTLWKDRREGHSPSNSIQIVGDHYYFSSEIEKNGVFVETLMRGSIYSKDYEPIIELPIDRIQLFNDTYGSFWTSHVYTENGSTKAFIPFSENIDIFKGQEFNSYVSYNITNQTYDFEKVRLPDTVGLSVLTRPVIIQDMMIVSADRFIYGTNRHSGEVAWARKTFAGRLSNDRLITAGYKDRLFAVSSMGGRDLVMELNPYTGNTIWIDEGNGAYADYNLHFLNDVLYFIKGRLYAYDINSGKMLWKLKSPDDAGFMTMQVHKAASAEDEDMLVACSRKNAYRFEPAQ